MDVSVSPHKNAPSQDSERADTSDRSSGWAAFWIRRPVERVGMAQQAILAAQRRRRAAGNAAANLGKTSQEQLDLTTDLRMAIRARASTLYRLFSICKSSDLASQKSCQSVYFLTPSHG